MSVRRTLAAALAAGLLLTGCTDEPEPEFTPTETPSPSVTESETAAPEAQSPEEFIQEWFDLNTEMQNTGETDVFLSSSPGCKPCARLADQVEEFYDAGGFIRVKRQTVGNVDELGGGTFMVTVDAAPTTYKESSSAQPTRLGGGPNEYRIVLRKRGSEWSMVEYLDTPS